MNFMAFRLFVYIFVYVFVVKNMTWAKPLSSTIDTNWTMSDHSTKLKINDGDLVALGMLHSGNCTTAYVDGNTCMSGTIPSSHCYRQQSRCSTGWMITKDIAWNANHGCKVYKWSWFCTKPL